MELVTHALHLILGIMLFYGSKLGTLCMLGLPGAIWLSRLLGDRFLRAYVFATTAAVGILIATLLTHIVKNV
jgi:hypothetical protein